MGATESDTPWEVGLTVPLQTSIKDPKSKVLNGDPGLTSKMSSFLLKMLHDIFPTREWMHRINILDTPSAVCTLREDNIEDNCEQALLTYSYIKVCAEILLLFLQRKYLNMTAQTLKFLDFRPKDMYP